MAADQRRVGVHRPPRVAVDPFETALLCSGRTAVITLDTHKFIRVIEAAAFDPKQADAFMEAQGEAELATKLDRERPAAKLEIRFERIDGELRPNRWMLGLMLAGVVSLMLEAFF